jgi:ATP-dependent helicase HrpA
VSAQEGGGAIAYAGDAMPTPLTAPTLTELRARLPELMTRDAHRLGRRLDGARRLRGPAALAELQRIAPEIEAAAERTARRQAAVPAVNYPAELPIAQRRDEIAAAIRDHQVVIVAGETGSGKTTQLPKICLELGRGVRGMIGHTQPRRIAARAVADRIAAELATPLGQAVGWKVRFTDQVGQDTLVKLMTDGILLAEIQQDRALRQYDTLIIDEAHERSLNVDFLLGYVKRLLPRRPDLKLVITSATIDPERFARHFDGAPVIEVSGRTYPVQVRYRPLAPEPDEPAAADADPAPATGGELDQVQGVCAAVDELCALGPGDILVFLSGEREIRDTADALGRRLPPGAEVLPLYARLSAAEQQRVFQDHPGRRIVLATNVAETSLTVPGIRYVVDAGTARISRYSHRTKVQRLPIEAISQASANQRAGRCGRLADGVCVRLYSERDFLARPAFTDPEILRTNLASVILAMTALGLGEVAAFPFVDPPEARAVTDGVRLLNELGALAPEAEHKAGHQLTPLGRNLAKLPLDPRLGRMVLEADAASCLSEVLVITAALSIQDPRERPAERAQAADEQHARFTVEGSDFLGHLALWNYLKERQRELSGNQFRRMCRTEFLNYLRVREWQDVHAQLRQTVRSLGMTPNESGAPPESVHRALLAGLLSHIGLKDGDKHEYLAARNARFSLAPSSALFRKQPRWVMAAELVETNRLWGRVAAKIEPEWAEKLAEHLVKRSYSEPHWERNRGSVVALERVTLYGVPLVAGRKVDYGRIDPELSRELFIRHALVEGDWRTEHAFYRENLALLAETEALEDRARRRDILVDDEALFDFYDQRIDAEVVSARHFDAWWKRTRASSPRLLNFSASMLVNTDADQVRGQDYPDRWPHPTLELPLSYQFEPGSARDGVTVHVPLAVLGQLRAADFHWQVPGLREELVTALIRSLPKPVRRELAPAPDHARAALRRLAAHAPEHGPPAPLLPTLGRELRELSGVDVPPDAWQWDRVPDHLKVTFEVLDERGRPVAAGKDLTGLAAGLRERVRAAIASVAPGVEASGLRAWSFGALPASYEQVRAGQPLRAYPALVDQGDSVAIRLFENETDARAAMWPGVRRLLACVVPSPAKAILGGLDYTAKLALSRGPHGSASALFEDCLNCALDTVIAEGGGPVRDQAGFDALAARARQVAPDRVRELVGVLTRVLASTHQVEQRLAALTSPVLGPAVADVREQLAGLVFPGFVTATGFDRAADLPRYLRGIELRLDKLPNQPERDQDRMRALHEVRAAYLDARRRLAGTTGAASGLAEIRWMLEELRVSYFAQTLGTAYPVSDKRVLRAIEQLGPG